ncbi:MAG: thiamine phosphate synthase [Planctomycetota bacterium]|jgi:thiamine-phosphate pyrophosphorylase|nr:thiamine phosphate synthase [Planctomycetota bacterium]MDP6763752.1 thiamine phosphate synthase [Planctomycetota bacterium]MDP6990011.1 thiamine phosphate synthase [Planctomycetota bacterium]
MDGDSLRERLSRARLMLVLTPGVCVGRDPLAVVASVLPHVDAVQVRPKPTGAANEDGGNAPGPARSTFELALGVLELCAGLAEAPLVIANDRVDVALALAERGLAGVHLGADDLPPGEARQLLGPAPLIGLSTHCAADVVRAGDLPVDYLGFGPLFSTTTKGYERGVGPEAAWVAASAAAVPLFSIGGITRERATQLHPNARIAVASAVLAAEDPAAAAIELRALLEGE